MSNLSAQIMFISGVRATGSKAESGYVFGGVYYPAHMKNGQNVSARWEGNVAINGRDWTDDSGAQHEGRRVYMRLVAWNSKNAAAGKGLADTFAKYVSVGKAISCSVKAESFDKRLFLNGQPVNDAQGNPITYPAIVFRVTGDLVFGDDSSKTIEAEVSRWNGELNFFSRPPQWNIVGTPDNSAWKQLIAARAAAVCDENAINSGIYGYARIIIPAGAQLGNPNIGTINSGNLTTGITPTEAAGQLNTTQAGGTIPQLNIGTQAGVAGAAGGTIPNLNVGTQAGVAGVAGGLQMPTLNTGGVPV